MHKNCIYSIFLFLLLSLTTSVFGQSIDSLEAILDGSQGKERVDIYNELFKAYLQSEPQRAIYYSRNGLEYAESINYPLGVSQALNNLGVAFKNQGVYDKALEFYSRAFSINDSIKNNDGLASNLNNIGNIYVIKNDKEKALEYFLNTYEIVRYLGNDRRTISILNNIGNVYSDRTFHDKAIEYYNKAIQISNDSNMAEMKFDPFYNIGNIWFLRTRYDSALIYYNKAFDVASEELNMDQKIYALINISKCYLQLSNFKTCEKYLNIANELAEKDGKLKHLMDILKMESEMQFAKGNAADAYKTLLEYDIIKDKIYSEDANRRIAETAKAVEFRLADRVNISNRLLEEQKKEIIDLELQRSRIAVVFGLMLLFFLVAAGFIYYLLNKDKKIGVLKS